MTFEDSAYAFHQFFLLYHYQVIEFPYRYYCSAEPNEIILYVDVYKEIYKQYNPTVRQ